MIRSAASIVLLLACALAFPAHGKSKEKQASALDRYIEEATRTQAGEAAAASPGSLWTPASRMTDMTRDQRASRVADIVTIVVAERASAVSSGTLKSSRSSSTSNSVTKLGGITRATGPFANLAELSGDTQLAGQGSTSRDVVLTTTMAARVTHVLPNGNLVIEGVKDIQVNSERQTVTVRGVVRPIDLTPDNAVRSDRVAQLEVQLNGKGVVADAVRRPFFLYRLLLGVLPF